MIKLISMPDKKTSPGSQNTEHCIECHLGLDECVECGACDACDQDATLDESELPPNWLGFIERSKKTV